jgi:hypothetical protein
MMALKSTENTEWETHDDATFVLKFQEINSDVV